MSVISNQIFVFSGFDNGTGRGVNQGRRTATIQIIDKRTMISISDGREYDICRSIFF